MKGLKTGHTTEQKLQVFSVDLVVQTTALRNHSVPILSAARDTQHTEEQGCADTTPIFQFYVAQVWSFVLFGSFVVV